VSRENLETYLYSVTGDVMLRVVHGLTADLDVREEDARLVADLYKFALVGMVLEWLENGMKEDPEGPIHRMGLLLEGNIRYTLEKAAAPKKALGPGKDVPSV
jgi:hypothetical protein